MSLALFMMLILFAILMFLGVPLSFTMILGSLFYFLISGKPLYLIVHRMFTGIDTFTLMAIPFFILAGELMVYSGTAKKLLDFSNLLVGRFRGGLGYVNVLASMLFGGCSGSAISDVAGLGTLELKMMETAGYDKSFSTAVTISSAIQGPIIPPSIPIVLIGAITGTSIGGLLLGSAIPGVLVGLAQMLVVFYVSRKRNFPRNVLNIKLLDKIRIVIESIPFLIMPLIIIGGIIGGFFTPTEASAVAVFYGFLLTLIFNKNVSLRDIKDLFKRSVITAASVLFLSASSNIFGWILATEHIPEVLGNILSSISPDPKVFLLIVNIVLLIWGMFMDSLPAITILAPILFPIAMNYGIHPIHFGVVMNFNLVIGLITPPYGVALFTGMMVSGLPMEKIVKDMTPFIFASICILFLVTYFPNIIMFLPSLFGLNR